MNVDYKKLDLKIKGMHCASCEVLIESELKKIKGIHKVNADFASGNAEIYYSEKPSIDELNDAIKKHGYSVLEKDYSGKESSENPDYFEVFMFFAIVIGVYWLLKFFNLSPDIGVKENMGLGLVFLIGLVAAVSSCLAVSGGLLLAVTAKYNEMHPAFSGWQKFKPNIYFNLGRIASYTFFGAVIGAFGSVLALSSTFNGWLILIASFIMIILGFQLIGIFPWLNKIIPKMPKFISHKMNDSKKEHWAAPFIFGAGTFFLPCGFTMALQFYVLSKGNAFLGAITMLVFSLGTMPALASLGAITSYVKKSIREDFMKFAGTVVILMGILSIPNGVSLAGLNFDFSSNPNEIDTRNINPYIAQYIQNQRAPMQKTEIVDGKQIARMKIKDINYIPSKFIVQKGIPVEWQIDASEAAGCAQVISAPKLGILESLSAERINVISFVPPAEGVFKFSCTMGMTTPGASFNVV